jgi:hypothetical protein
MSADPASRPLSLDAEQARAIPETPPCSDKNDREKPGLPGKNY